MRPVKYKDDRGYLHRVMVKDDDPDEMARFGIPAGPPDLHELDWEEIIRQMNNALVEHGLNSWLDVQRSPIGVQVATTVVRRYLIDLYRRNNR